MRYHVGLKGVIILYFLLCFLSLLSGPHLFGGEPQDRTKMNSFFDALERLRFAKKIPGLSVAVLQDGELLGAKGMGTANLETGVPATSETPYDIASVTKPLSATYILQLVEQGALELDRPMASYSDWADFCLAFSEQPSIFAKHLQCEPAVHTMRHLLSHTAIGRPGTHFSYNPVLYSWASRPVMAVIGTSYSMGFQAAILQPLNMRRSARRYRDLPLPPSLAADLAPPHRMNQNGQMEVAPPQKPQGDGAAGGVISTVLDLAAFDRALDADLLLKPETKAMMFRRFRNHKGEPQDYALGWWAETYRGLELRWHSGWWENAYSALYLKVPAKKLTLILLANSEGVWWGNPLDEAKIRESEFAQLFFEKFL